MGAFADNTDVAAGQIPVSVARTGRYGTGGQVLLGSTKLTVNDLQHVQRVVTNAEVKALASTKIELVPAQGADTLIVPERITVKHTYESAAFSDEDLTIEYDNGSALAVATIDATNFLNGVSASTIRPIISPVGGAAILDAAADIVNKNLALAAGSNPTTGGGTVTVDIWYRVVSYV